MHRTCEKGGNWCPPDAPFCINRTEKYNRGFCTAACEKGGYYCQNSAESCEAGKCCVPRNGDCERNPNCCAGTHCDGSGICVAN
ncbi:unnamed protein product [Zymoseptoria tritici ST99CH_1A5]|uniref:Uncharacterized protein n=3 Tax=Zymoseptoria tritici TaxID=1047171 RepID=A0A1X7RJS6_ZYMT9|nr:unnamed protein product [Zymoseptoria tritici ST99CH_3D7]SMR46193.1 unnamed protein product [Zymoseptoria tritici ST99CH_1E4]SMR47444.1 unnamed protein product [Zymoseptoria tritici ST99CH_3D1]SMY21342.1 unnamed protein product [Zymoseptoria tritici ST99CH_1A5]